MIVNSKEIVYEDSDSRTGCAKCRMLEENAVKAANELNIEYQLEEITDPDKIKKIIKENR
jgi:hypothetical protein